MTSAIIHYQYCPACNSKSISKVMVVEDHSVSHQQFEIWECGLCSLRFTQNVPDEKSIGAYYQSPDYISHSNTKRGLVNKLYHLVRNITLKQKRDLIAAETGLIKGHVLDIGAGTGTFISFMKQTGWPVTGLEPDAATREKALENYGINIQASGELFNLPPKTFDVITLWHVLEHVHNLNGYLQKIKELLKPEGVVFIAVPNYTSDDAHRYKEKWAAYDVPIHLYHFSPGAMKALLLRHGFILKSVKPMWFDSFYVSLLSEKYKTGRQNLAAGFLSGFISNFKAVSDQQKCSSLIYIITAP